MDAEKKALWHYAYFTEDVAAKARTDELLQDLILAVVHITADCDMHSTGKLTSSSENHSDSYHYFREILDRLGIPPQAILDVIDECFPEHPGTNLTERDDVVEVPAELVENIEASAFAYVG